MLAQYGSPEDILAMAKYLYSKPAGASVVDVKTALGATAVDGRKLAALAQWGFIALDEGRISLRERGRDVAREPGRLAAALRDVIREERAYRAALERAHFQRFATLDQRELGAFWHEHFGAELGSSAEQSIARACSAFLRLASAAELGEFTLGRKGSASRLTIDVDALGEFISGDSSFGEGGSEEDQPDQLNGGDDAVVSLTPPLAAPTKTTDELRFFVSHGKNMELVEQVTALLEVANVPFEIAVDEESPAIPVPEKVLNSMRRCNAGIVIVSVDNEDDPKPVVNDNVLIEIGAAFVLYDKHVVLIWDKRLPVPSNLQGLYRCEFEGAELGWSSGVKLMKTIGSFRQQPAA